MTVREEGREKNQPKSAIAKHPRHPRSILRFLNSAALRSE
jgi:hypothetical protein